MGKIWWKMNVWEFTDMGLEGRHHRGRSSNEVDEALGHWVEGVNGNGRARSFLSIFSSLS